MADDDDPLAQYRRPGAKRAEKPVEVPPSKSGRKSYLAYEAKDKLLCLEIRRVLGTTHAPTYAYLLNLSFDHEYYTGFVLYFSFLQVKVRGRNLREVINAIKMRNCEFIQDFHAGEYEQPKPDEPIIESITVEWRDPMMNGRGSEKDESGEPRTTMEKTAPKA